MQRRSADAGAVAGELDRRRLHQTAGQQLLHDVVEVALLDPKLLRQLAAEDAACA